MPPIYDDGQIILHAGDCLDVLAGLEDNSVDSCVTDPPYGLEFMGREWDGADGFRRSLNPADAGRDNVFGRASRTGPEYRTAGTGKRGRPGIGDRDTEWVSNQGWNGFRCRNCGHLSHGGSPCRCDAPEFVRADNRWHLYQAWCERWAAECLRVLKPGGHLVAFGGTRTYHRLVCAIEDAGFEIRDSLHWIYGSGFPKSLDVSKAIDKAARGVPQGGADPTSVNHGRYRTQATEGSRGDGDRGQGYGAGPGQFMAVAGERETRDLVAEAAQWEGWGTALKPAHEPIVLARKPLTGTVAANVLAHGTGALNIDGCRVQHASDADRAESVNKNRHGDFGTLHGGNAVYGDYGMLGTRENYDGAAGRWPPNLLLTHSADCQQVGTRAVTGGGRDQEPGRRPGGFGDVGAAKGDGRPNGPMYGGELVAVYDCAEDCPVAELDRQSGVSSSTGGPTSGTTAFGQGSGWNPHNNRPTLIQRPADNWCASRFFPVFRYEAKAGTAERPRSADGTAHPTVKPARLLQWLVRLVTPPGGLVLDPFAGTGTTGEACIVEGFRCVLIERDAGYVELIRARLRKPLQPGLW